MACGGAAMPVCETTQQRDLSLEAASCGGAVANKAGAATSATPSSDSPRGMIPGSGVPLLLGLVPR